MWRKKEAATNYSIVVFGVHGNLGQLDVHNKVFRVLQWMISLVKSKRAVVLSRQRASELEQT